MYTTKANIENRLGRTLTAKEDSFYTTVLSSGIDKIIDNITSTTFGSSADVEVFVDGDGSGNCVVPTMHDVTAVKTIGSDNAETVITNSYYTLYPYGSDQVYALLHRGGVWPEGLGNIKIEGKLGYKNVPADITLIATELASSYFTKNVSGYKSEKVGDWQAVYSDIENLVTNEMRKGLESYVRLSRRI